MLGLHDLIQGHGFFAFREIILNFASFFISLSIFTFIFVPVGILIYLLYKILHVPKTNKQIIVVSLILFLTAFFLPLSASLSSSRNEIYPTSFWDTKLTKSELSDYYFEETRSSFYAHTNNPIERLSYNFLVRRIEVTKGYYIFHTYFNIPVGKKNIRLITGG